MLASDAITGLVLAGGQGARMGGVDKGLQLWRGEPLARHALRRLQPQVASAAISANRHLDDYRAWGVPAWPDTWPGFAGPLAGWLSGLQHCKTPYLVTVPCDTPGFPVDLVARLWAGLCAANAQMAVARTPERPQPVFCLMSCMLAGDLRQYLERGERQVLRWTSLQCNTEVLFDETAAFRNFNTLADLDCA